MSSTSPRRRGRPAGQSLDLPQRREEILDAVERVIESGVRDPSIADIAAEAGYARTAVYAAFADRGVLLVALARRHTERLLAAARQIADEAQSIRELVCGVIELVCEFVETRSDLYPLFMQMILVDTSEGPHRPLFVEVADWASGELEAAMTRAGLPTTAARTWSAAIAGATLLAAEDWNTRRDRTRAELAAEITDLVWPGLEAAGLGAPG